MKITMEGNWQTEDGRSVRIISLDGPKDTPVVGVIEGNPNVLAWQADGQYNHGVNHCTDLVPVQTKNEGWVIIPDIENVRFFTTKDYAEGAMYSGQCQKPHQKVVLMDWET